MKKLFPYRYKFVSGILFILGIAGLIMLLYIDTYADDETAHNFINMLGGDVTGILKTSNVFYDLYLDEALFVIASMSGLVLAFSQEKREDETVAAIRKQCLIKAFVINYTFLMVAYLAIYGFAAYTVIYISVFSPLVIFIIIFRYKIFKYYKAV